MADAMADLEAEIKKQREAQEAQANKLKAQQQALFDLSGSGQSGQSSTKAAKQGQGDEQLAPTRATSSTAQPSKTSASEKPQNPAVYIPPTWHTAGQEPDLSQQPRRAEGVNETLVDTESVALPMCGCGGPGPGIGTQLFAMAGLNPPSEASFDEFFRSWFEREHFPQMSEDLKKELVQRAKSKSFFSGISSQFKKWAMANTDARLQSDVWCKYFTDNAPPRYQIFGCMRVASVNLGSQVVPCWITFYGLPEQDGGAKWILLPFTHNHADISALLDELDGRGGMTALLQAAAS
jgi:hypothetical protein